MTAFPSLFEVAFDGGKRNTKQLGDLGSCAAFIDRTYHSLSQILGVSFHGFICVIVWDSSFTPSPLLREGRLGRLTA